MRDRLTYGAFALPASRVPLPANRFPQTASRKPLPANRFLAMRSGFTQLELMVVLIIGGILTTLGIPRLVRLRDASSVRAAMTDVGSAFATARQASVTRRTTVSIVFDTAGGALRVSSAGETILRRSLRATYSVSIGANRDSAVYDARGLGYGVTNLSLTVRRGTFVDTLTMSRLGRTVW